MGAYSISVMSFASEILPFWLESPWLLRLGSSRLLRSAFMSSRSWALVLRVVKGT